MNKYVSSLVGLAVLWGSVEAWSSASGRSPAEERAALVSQLEVARAQRRPAIAKAILAQIADFDRAHGIQSPEEQRAALVRRLEDARAQGRAAIVRDLLTQIADFDRVHGAQSPASTVPSHMPAPAMPASSSGLVTQSAPTLPSPPPPPSPPAWHGSSSSSSSSTLDIGEIERRREALRATEGRESLEKKPVVPVRAYFERTIKGRDGQDLKFPEACAVPHATDAYDTASDDLFPLDGVLISKGAKWFFRTFHHLQDPSYEGAEDHPVSPHVGQVLTGLEAADVPTLLSPTQATRAVTAHVDNIGGYVMCLTKEFRPAFHGATATPNIAPGGAGERPSDLAAQGH